MEEGVSRSSPEMGPGTPKPLNFPSGSSVVLGGFLVESTTLLPILKRLLSETYPVQTALSTTVLTHVRPTLLSSYSVPGSG